MTTDDTCFLQSVQRQVDSRQKDFRTSPSISDMFFDDPIKEREDRRSRGSQAKTRVIQSETPPLGLSSRAPHASDRENMRSRLSEAEKLLRAKESQITALEQQLRHLTDRCMYFEDLNEMVRYASTRTHVASANACGHTGNHRSTAAVPLSPVRVNIRMCRRYGV